MKTFRVAVLAASLLIPLAGCGGPGSSGTEAPADVIEKPGDNPFAGGGEKGDDAVLEAPPLEPGDTP